MLLILLALLIPIICGQTTSTTTRSTSSSSTTTVPPWTDPTNGGKVGNGGAQVYLTNRTVSTVTSNAMDNVVAAIRNATVPDVSFPIFLDLLTIRGIKVNEIKFDSFENQYLIPDRIQTRFRGGRLMATGQWKYQPAGNKPSTGGTFKATIINAEVKLMHQTTRTIDAKPMLRTTDCKMDLKQFRADLEGAPPAHSVVENCTNPVCNKVRSHFEDIACSIIRGLVRDTINVPLSTFPTRVRLNCTNQFYLDYRLMGGEPKVFNAPTPSIRTGLEGKAQWSNGFNFIPFWPHEYQPIKDKSMYIFDLSDYVFNTLFQHAHSQQYQFSASALIPAPSLAQQPLNLKCPGRVCLGSIFNSSTIDQYPANALGDLVYKSKQRPIRLFVQENRGSNFDGSSGTIEIYGPAIGKRAQRTQLAQIDVQLLRGDFVPSLKQNKITGSLSLTNLQFRPSSSKIPLLQDWPSKLAQIAQPILNDIFNAFLSQVAQLPIPLPSSIECVSPTMSILSRSVRIECDVRYNANLQTNQGCK